MRVSIASGAATRALSFVLLAVLFAIAMGATPVDAQDPQAALSQASVTTRFEGYLKAIGRGKWLVGDLSVLVDEQTRFVEKRGRLEVGAQVIVWGTRDEVGIVRADLIQVDRPAGSGGPVVQFAGILHKQAGEWWVIGDRDTLVQVTPETRITGVPQVNGLLWVVAVQDSVLKALAIEVIADTPDAVPVEFEGTIVAIDPPWWQIDAQRVYVRPGTPIIGEEIVGNIAEVQASRGTDDTLTAILIRVVGRDTEANLGAYVAAITAGSDGTETWEMLFFPEQPWTDPEPGLVHVTANTYVDESRAVARAGQWAEVQGVQIARDEYQADIVRLEQPVPVALEGSLDAATTAQASSGWWTFEGQPVWLSTPAMQATAARAEGRVTLRGLRLANGVIWVQGMREPAGGKR